MNKSFNKGQVRGNNGQRQNGQINKAPSQRMVIKNPVPRPSLPRDQNFTDTTAMQTKARVFIPMMHSRVLKMCSVLCVQHYAGDVTVLDVFYPTKRAQGFSGPAAMSEEIILSGESLKQRGDRYMVVGVYVTASGVAFQRFSVEQDKLLPLHPKPANWFPDIREASREHLNALTKITALPGREQGMRFEVNTQIRWKEYQSLRTASELEAYNKREIELFKQAMDEFADVEPGTPLAVARVLVAARLASSPDNVVDKTDPSFGFEDAVVQVESADAHDWSSPARTTHTVAA